MKKILYSIYYRERDPFDFFDVTIPVGSISQLKEPGVVILWGGEDISTKIYGQKPNKFVQPNRAEYSERDLFEIQAAEHAVKNGWPIIGVCRGAQLMCSLSGGSLVQHVTGHHGNHYITTFDGQVLTANSIHHQMMNLENTKHELIAWSSDKLSKEYLIENEIPIELDKEPEIVFFNDTNVLAIQGHPEYLYPQNKFVQYCTKQIERKYGDFLR